jgi:excisionase family DNA binding protein
VTSARHDAHDAESLVGAAEAAAILGTSERTIRRKIAAGVLPSIKIGGQRRTPVSALDLSQDHDGAALILSGNHDGPGVTRTPSAVDLSPLAAIIERQALEIARLSGALATAEERLRAIEAGRVMTGMTDTPPPTTSSAPPGSAESTDTTNEPLTGLRGWWRRLWGGS